MVGILETLRDYGGVLVGLVLLLVPASLNPFEAPAPCQLYAQRLKDV